MSDWLQSLSDTEDQRSKLAEQAARKRRWLPGSEHTGPELLALERQRKTDFLEREQRRAA